jgi:hypothetical protein
MLRRAPMHRGSGFKRPERVRAAPAPLRPATRSGVISMVGDQVVAIEKENPLVCEAYRKVVRSLPCIRCGILGFTQFCHSDEGKGMGLKTDDRRAWPGCGPHGDTMGCHHYVGTSGSMPRAEKRVFEETSSSITRATVLLLGLWPKNLPLWPE